ncbi:MAG: putative selenate ABC transporter substrate-binding protein [Cyanobacteria bacterium P01_F01_bin.42]
MLNRRQFITLAVGTGLFIGCSSQTGSPPSSQDRSTFVVGAIPDQDPEKLQRLYGKLTDYLGSTLDVDVAYKPVTDYAAAVTAFRVGDLDMVWFGGLTGVQARLQVPQAQAIAQRDIDAKFTSVFIAHQSSNLSPFNSAQDLSQLKDLRMTFGSESSTSGRLMPQYFLQDNGVSLEDFKGDIGFSGSHDKTLKLVESGTYEVGALNSQVWRDREAEGSFNPESVQVIWETPSYYDYHWVINPAVAERFGDDFIPKVQQSLLDLNLSDPDHQQILDLFGAASFIATKNENYQQIEAVGREIGKIQ